MPGPARLAVVFYRDSWGSVEFAVRASGEIPSQQFLQGECRGISEKGRDDPRGTAEIRFVQLFYQMAKVGPQRISSKRFHRLGGGLSYFRHEVRKSQIRFPCFFDGNHCILTHGFVKPGAKKKLGKWPEEQLKRANEIMAEYFRRKGAVGPSNLGRQP